MSFHPNVCGSSYSIFGLGAYSFLDASSAVKKIEPPIPIHKTLHTSQ